MWTFTVRLMRAPLLLKWMLIRFGMHDLRWLCPSRAKVDVVRFEYTSEDSASSAPLMLAKSTFTFDDAKQEAKRPLEIFLYDEVSASDWSFSDTLEYVASDFWLAQPVLLDDVDEVS